MMHVVIDTSVYRTDPKRGKAGFQAITRLAAARRIRIHLPYYIRQEVLTQQAELLSKEFNKAIKSLASVERITAQKSTVDVINQTLGEIKKLANDAAATACEELDFWIENTQTLTYEFDDSHGKRVTDAYFAGGEPFSRPKHRMDFPDGFIYESVKDISGKHGTLHVIVADGNLKDACERLGDVRTYDSIEEFIRLPECQTLLRNLDRVISIDRIRDRLPKELGVTEEDLRSHVIDFMGDRIVTGSTPDDDNEALVCWVATLRDTEFKFDQAEYYGEGEIGIPFSTVVECGLDFYNISAVEIRDVDIEGRLILRLPTDELQRYELTDEDLNVLINEADCILEIDRSVVS